MHRIILTYFLPLIFPTVIYLLWRKGTNTPKETPFPVRDLVLWGLLMMAVSLSFFVIRDRYPADSVYTPPRFIDGQVVPAHTEPKVHAD